MNNTFDILMDEYAVYLNEWECPYCGRDMDEGGCCCGECHASQRQDTYDCPTFEEWVRDYV
jgi:hypothetical protein